MTDHAGTPAGPPPALVPWEKDCLRLLGQRVVVAGVGNRDLGDDGVGPAVAEALREEGLVTAIDCGTTPENYTGRIVEAAPTDVIFVDAADLGAEPGTVRLLKPDELQAHSPSTHAPGLAACVAFLAAACGARCRLLAVQPAHRDQGGGLSPPVRDAVARIVASRVWSPTSLR